MSNNLITITENNLYLVFEVSEEKDIRLLHFSSLPYEEVGELTEEQRAKCRLLELQLTGEDQLKHKATKHTVTMPGGRLIFSKFDDERNKQGRKLTFHLNDKLSQVEAAVIFQFYSGLGAVRTWTVLTNNGKESVGIEYVSTFSLLGIDRGGISDRERKMRVHICHNEWYAEAMWRDYQLSELGAFHVNYQSSKKISISNTGNWSASQYIPTGFIENRETGSGLLWQIEHNGSWNWEISDMMDLLYVKVSGPSELENHWWKELQPKQSFTTVPVAIVAAQGGLQEHIGIMTAYRRRIRRENADNKNLPVIFNDYMNCLSGDPTTAKLIPLIEAAKEAGCEYFCIDSGWYSDGGWWDGVGEWLPSEQRFPNGIEEPLNYIKKCGMIPGIWIELEVMGINCPLVSQLPDEWFFMRHGKRVIDHSRYQLDFRNPEVRSFACGIIDRLVLSYGVGYIKMDYNIDMGIGTDWQASSAGDGLLEHNRAYLNWLDEIFAKYPDLVIENCSSGGLRMDYALLSRHSIQSSSDQTDYRKNAVIAAAAPSVVTPEQCAVWSYPLRDGEREQAVCNMINAMLGRIHQSGHLADLKPDSLACVKEGIRYYKGIRKYIPESTPFWPSKIPYLGDEWVAYGIKSTAKSFLAVWRIDSSNAVMEFPVSHLIGKNVKASIGYPTQSDIKWRWNKERGTLSVELPENGMARLFEFTVVEGEN